MRSVGFDAFVCLAVALAVAVVATPLTHLHSQQQRRSVLAAAATRDASRGTFVAGTDVDAVASVMQDFGPWALMVVPNVRFEVNFEDVPNEELGLRADVKTAPKPRGLPVFHVSWIFDDVLTVSGKCLLVPERPGVYEWAIGPCAAGDQKQTVLKYVGKSVDLRSRCVKYMTGGASFGSTQRKNFLKTLGKGNCLHHRWKLTGEFFGAPSLPEYEELRLMVMGRPTAAGGVRNPYPWNEQMKTAIGKLVKAGQTGRLMAAMDAEIIAWSRFYKAAVVCINAAPHLLNTYRATAPAAGGAAAGAAGPAPAAAAAADTVTALQRLVESLTAENNALRASVEAFQAALRGAVPFNDWQSLSIRTSTTGLRDAGDRDEPAAKRNAYALRQFLAHERTYGSQLIAHVLSTADAAAAAAAPAAATTTTVIAAATAPAATAPAATAPAATVVVTDQKVTTDGAAATALTATATTPAAAVAVTDQKAGTDTPSTQKRAASPSGSGSGAGGGAAAAVAERQAAPKPGQKRKPLPNPIRRDRSASDDDDHGRGGGAAKRGRSGPGGAGGTPKRGGSGAGGAPRGGGKK